jgi:dinuclear metal center YbgI/SA1388 family protein
MPLTVQDILNIIEKIAPASLAEDWDNVGLMLGNPSSPVDAILIGLDPTLELLEEASSCGANLLITHHPFIFHPFKTIHLGSPEGVFVERAIQKQINVVSCHTNLDSAAEGVSYSLAQKLGLEDSEPLLVHHGADLCGMGRIGKYREAISVDEFIGKLRDACSPPWLLATANKPAEISCVAVCGGSCSELAPVALEKGAQVFVTSEVKHSIARWAEQAGLWVVDGGHFATENQALTIFAENLEAEASQDFNAVDIHVTRQQESPLLLV